MQLQFPSGTEEELTSSVMVRKAGSVGTPALVFTLAPTGCKEEEQILDDGDTPASTGALAMSSSGREVLRREQW
jgi:hypothetical protein